MASNPANENLLGSGAFHERAADTRVSSAWGDRVRQWLPAGVTVAFALALYLETRLWLVHKFPYFIDEGVLAGYAQAGRNADQRLISLYQGVRPGLVWLTLAGMSVRLDPLVSIRVVAVVFGLVTLAAGAVLARRYVGRTAAVAFVALALFTPLLFLYDALGLRDSVVAGLVLSGFLFELELARRPRLAIALLLGLTFAGDVLVKESGKVALYLLPLSLAYFPFRSSQRLRLGLAWAGCVALALALAWIAALPLKLSSLYGQLGATQRALGEVRSFAQVRDHPLRYFDDTWPMVRGELVSYFTYPVIVLAIAGLVLGLRRHTRFTALVTLWALVQLTSVFLLPTIPYPRYLVPAGAFILLLAAIGFCELLRIVRAVAGSRPWVTATLVAAVVLAVVPALNFDARSSYDPASAPYPPLDKEQYITGYASGLGIEQAVGVLGVLALGHQRLVVLSDPGRAPLALYVLAATRGLDVEWVWPPSPDTKAATVLLTNEHWVNPELRRRFREVWRYVRPDGGVPLTLYAKA